MAVNINGFTGQDIYDLAFITADDVTGAPTRAQAALGAMKYNTLLVLERGTDEAVEDFKVDLLEAFDAVETAQEWVAAIIRHHNIMFGASNAIVDRFVW